MGLVALPWAAAPLLASQRRGSYPEQGLWTVARQGDFEGQRSGLVGGEQPLKDGSYPRRGEDHPDASAPQPVAGLPGAWLRMSCDGTRREAAWKVDGGACHRGEHDSPRWLASWLRAHPPTPGGALDQQILDALHQLQLGGRRHLPTMEEAHSQVLPERSPDDGCRLVPAGAADMLTWVTEFGCREAVVHRDVGYYSA